MIETKSLSCAYTHKIIENLSFKSAHNLVILGANGAGKSTLAKALCGLLAYKGEVMINHRPLSQLSPQERAKEITYIPPKLESYDPFISVLEFVLMGRYPYKSPFTAYSEEEIEVAKELIEKSALDAQQSISSLSSGQQQLLLITQALAQESSIIIFDEPTANLDPKHSLSFYHALQNLNPATQKIIITHDLNLAYKLKYDVLFISDKRGQHYQDSADFFRPENLKACYGVTFQQRGGMLGVHYE